MKETPESIHFKKPTNNLEQTPAEDPFTKRQEQLLEIKNKEEEFKLIIKELREKLISEEINLKDITPIIDKIEQDFSDNYKYTVNLIEDSTPPQE